MTENIIVIIVIALVAYICYDVLKLYVETKQCPKCNASFFATRYKGREEMGFDIHNNNRKTYRSFYECKRCKHHWNDVSSRCKKNDY